MANQKTKQVKISEAYTTAREDRIVGTIDGAPFVIVAKPGTVTTNESVGRIITANFDALAATDITTISKTFSVTMEQQAEGSYPPVWVFISVNPSKL